ncbi:MFS transporter [Dactylosporangium sp. NPDC006015]|uniref:MFS transporter n=1 Tax=Dactylosporangium sp. NPDC006015 TaxID=3154576 RepID=UPI0033B97EBF
MKPCRIREPQQEAAARDRAADRRDLLLLSCGVVLLACNLRPAVTSLPPIFPEMQTHLHLSLTAVTVVATIPVLAFGVFAPVAASFGRRYGEERTLAVALLVLAGALAARAAFPGIALFAATAMSAGAIAVMSVLLTSMIRRRQPRRTGLLLGLYLFALYIGAMVGSAASVPLFEASGGSWLVTLGVWCLPAVAALLVWLPQWSRPAGTAPGDAGKAPAVYRSALAWQVAAFMGLQSLIYYSTLSWLPSFFRDRGATPGQAGLLVSMLSIGGLVTALITPMLAQRRADQRVLVVAGVTICAVGLAGAVAAPLSTAALWTGLLGLGQGGVMGLALYFTMARAGSSAESISLSAMAQCVGYLLATTGPLLVGLLHDGTGGWRWPFALLFFFTAAKLVAGVLAGRARTLRGAGAAR